MKTRIDHADIVVTHKCNYNCYYCVDKYRNNPEKNEEISIENVDKFLDKIKNNTEYIPSFGNEKLTVLLLGGEPTLLSSEKLINISKSIVKRGYSPHISTNGVNKDTIKSIIDYYEWIQITIHNNDEINYWRPYKKNINIKISGDKLLTYNKLMIWMDLVKDYPRKSVSMHISPDFQNLCKDKKVWNYINKNVVFERLGSYEYGFYNGVRFKKCIKNITNIIEEPLIPKLYPNGNYNKTWCNEELDDYIDGGW